MERRISPSSRLLPEPGLPNTKIAAGRAARRASATTRSMAARSLARPTNAAIGRGYRRFSSGGTRSACDRALGPLIGPRRVSAMLARPMPSLSLTLLPDRLAVCRLDPDAVTPEPAAAGFWSVTRTSSELSVVVAEAAVEVGWRAERGWRVLEVAGPLDFALTGILLSLVRPLADAGVPVFAISTFDTDYLLVKEADLAPAITALTGAGHAVRDP